MLEFHYEFLNSFFDSSNFQVCQMDTDSEYFACTAPSLELILKNESMAKRYNKAVYQSCNGDEAFLPDDENHWIPRLCCEKHNKFDSKTPGLFKSEFQGSAIVALCSKTYATEDAQNNKVKFSSKGLSKKAVQDSVEKEGVTSVVDLYKKVLNSESNLGGNNMGFKIVNNTMVTYDQFRAGISYFYIKRKVLDDGVSTLPLDVTLKPK